MRILAIDQGTTSTRAIVYSDDAPPRGAASLRHRQTYPRPGWVEHDPRELLENVNRCLEAAGPIDGIGIANQGESCLAWDAMTLEPLSPVIVWQDRRTAPDIERLRASGLGRDVTARTGLPLDCYFSASKMAWILRNSDGAKSAHRRDRLRLGTTDTFFLECLSKSHATDATTASRTSLMNLATLSWDPALCQAFGVPIELLAPIVPTSGYFGSYRNIPIRASVVDQQAALFGHGCRHKGDGKITFGTGAFALTLSGTTPPQTAAAGLVATVAWWLPPDIQYALEGSVYDAGAVIEWAMRTGIMHDPEELRGPFESAAIDGGLVFVPSLSGLGYPEWCRTASGLWTGMSTATTRRDLQKSLAEGIAMQTQRVIAAMNETIGLGTTLSVDGGLSTSDYFLQFLADVSNQVIRKSGDHELTALGCALLAGLKPPASAPTESQSHYRPAIDPATRASRIDRYNSAIQSAVALSTPGSQIPFA